MSDILTANVLIQGTRPLIWHAFGPDAMPLERREKTGVAGNDPEEWRRTVLMLPNRQLFIKPTYVFGCLRDGAKHTTRKRGTLQPLVAATLQVTDDVILIDRFLPDEPLPTDPTLPVYLDICGVKNPATRSRNVRYRVAASTGWHAEFNLLWDGVIVPRGPMEQVVIDAGRLVGLGDGRSIGMGRFELMEFSVSDGE